MRVIVIGLIFISNLGFGQQPELTDEQLNKSGAVRLVLADSTISTAVDFAKSDIENGTPFLLLQGGISPIVYGTDRDFERKYKVYFHDYGCTGPDEKLSAAYNSWTFDYLTKKYGTKWIKEIRKDVIGLRDWKEKK